MFIVFICTYVCICFYFRGYIYILYFTTIYIFLVKNKNPVPVIASILAIWLGMPCFAKQLHWSAWNFKLIDLIKIGHDVRYLWVVNSDILGIATIQFASTWWEPPSLSRQGLFWIWRRQDGHDVTQGVRCLRKALSRISNRDRDLGDPCRDSFFLRDGAQDISAASRLGKP